MDQTGFSPVTQLENDLKRLKAQYDDKNLKFKRSLESFNKQCTSYHQNMNDIFEAKRNLYQKHKTTFNEAQEEFIKLKCNYTELQEMREAKQKEITDRLISYAKSSDSSYPPPKTKVEIIPPSRIKEISTEFRQGQQAHIEKNTEFKDVINLSLLRTLNPVPPKKPVIFITGTHKQPYEPQNSLGHYRPGLSPSNPTHAEID
jgi:hypothetical protein